MGRILSLIGIPLRRQLPFFLIFIVLVGANVHAHILVKHDMTWREVLFDYGMLLGFSLILTFILDIAKSRILKGLFYAMVLVLFAVVSYLNMTFHTNVNAEILQLLFDTNINETLEFLYVLKGQNELYKVGSIVIIAALVAYITEKKYAKHANQVGKQCVSFGIVTLVILVMSTCSLCSFCKIYDNKDIKSYETWTDTHFTGHNTIAHTLKSLYYMKLSSGVNSIRLTKEVVEKDIVECKMQDSLNIVLVIGESFNKRHASLYGYNLQTTPFMQQEVSVGRMAIFDHVTTTSNKTTATLRNIFSCNSVADGENWSEHPFFPAIIRRGGYNVYFWDNQHEIGVETGGFSVELDSYLYHKDLKKISYTQINNQNFRYDKDLVSDFYSKSHLTKRNFVIFHLRGQHFTYNSRYPSKYNYFTEDSIGRNEKWMTSEKKRLIAEYDNAIRYNDAVLANIFDGFKASSTILIFFSDHGEEIYDYHDYKGRECLNPNDSAMWKENVMNIPFVIWWSDLYRHRYPEVVNRIQSSVDKKLSTDNLCHLLFGLTGIVSSYYNPKKNILSDSYEDEH